MKRNRKVLLLGVAAIMFVALVGAAALVSVNASRLVFDTEPESADLSECGVVVGSDPLASGGSSVEFDQNQGTSSNCGQPQQVVYYVDCDDGDDSNSGLGESSAIKTLARAENLSIQPGEKLAIKKGCEFRGQTLTLNWSGTVQKPITVGTYGQGWDPKIIVNTDNTTAVSINGKHLIIDSLHAVAEAWQTDPGCQNAAYGYTIGFAFNSGATDNVLTHSTAEGHYAGAFIKAGANNNLITHSGMNNNNMMSPLDTDPNQGQWASINDNDAGAFGVLIWGDDNEVAYSTFDNNIACSYDYEHDGGAVEFFGGSNNVVHHNTANNTETFTELGVGSGMYSTGNVLACNTMISSLNGGVFLNTRGEGQSFGPVYNTIAYNNSVYMHGPKKTSPASAGSQGPQGVVCSGCGPGILTMSNNLIWATWKGIYADAQFNESNNIFWTTAGETTVQGFNLSSSSSIANPLFAGAGSGDLSLSSGSPAIDAGSNAGINAGFATDIDGKSVPQGSAVDIGAHEK